MFQSSPVLHHHPHRENNTSEFIVTLPPARTVPLTTLISYRGSHFCYFYFEIILSQVFNTVRNQYSQNQRKEVIPGASESFERIEMDILNIGSLIIPYLIYVHRGEPLRTNSEL